MSTNERVLWAQIRKCKLGFNFRTQVRVSGYYLDFYCAEASLCIEVDGEQHQHRTAWDANRDRVLSEAGIHTLRIPSLDLFEGDGSPFSKWIDEIVRVCEERSGRKQTEPSPHRRRELD